MPGENDKVEILVQSFEIMRKAYEELESSAQSINSRAGITLALLGTFVTVTDLEPWIFHRPPYSNGWILGLLGNCLNLASIFLLVWSIIDIYVSLRSKSQKTPYDVQSLVKEQEQNGNEAPYTDLKSFYRQQMLNTQIAIADYQCVLSRKSRHFSRGLIMALCAIGLAVSARLIS